MYNSPSTTSLGSDEAGTRDRSSTVNSVQSVDNDLDCKLWTGLSVDDWSTSINDSSIFASLYDATLTKINTAVKQFGLDGVIDFGCGSGEIIGKLSERLSIPCVGMDINPKFISYCKSLYPKGEFIEASITDADKLWEEKGWHTKFKRPLLICCNNTLPILPIELRSVLVSQMLKLAGSEGKILITFWDGRYFPHAVLSFYKKRPELCGEFDIEDCVDFEARHLEVPGTGYCTTWLLAKEVHRMMESFDINNISYHSCKDLRGPLPSSGNYIEHVDIGIFFWACGSRNTAKDYYDSEDAQQFYSAVWGESTIHIGNYVLLEEMIDASVESIPSASRILLAQKLHEQDLISRIRHLMCNTSPFRVADLGCGYGGFLRDLTETGCVWRGYGFDISEAMINRCKSLSAVSASPYKDRISWKVESYLSTSIASEQVDVAFSMDAFLHVGDVLHTQVMNEAWRILRPGGYLIFTDIMQRADATPAQMEGVLERIHLTALGSVENYKVRAQKAGFSFVSFDDMSPCLPKHYGTVKKVLQEKRADGTLKSMNEAFITSMVQGLDVWEASGAFLQWGIFVFQKTDEPSYCKSGSSLPGF